MTEDTFSFSCRTKVATLALVTKIVCSSVALTRRRAARAGAATGVKPGDGAAWFEPTAEELVNGHHDR